MLAACDVEHLHKVPAFDELLAQVANSHVSSQNNYSLFSSQFFRLIEREQQQRVSLFTNTSARSEFSND